MSSQPGPDGPPPAQPTEQAGGGEGGGGATITIAPNIGYVKSIPGILKIVQFVLLLLAFAILADTVGSWGRKSFFLFVTITCWLVVIAVFLIFFLSIDKGINVSWTIILLINAVVWALLLLICSSLIADDAADIKKVLDSAYKRLGVRVSSSYDSIAAAAAFGFFSFIAVALEAAYHLVFGVLKKN